MRERGVDVVRVTGRENAKIVYCLKCGWQEEDFPIVAGANDCPMCRNRPLGYVRFERGVEDEAALAAMGAHRARWLATPRYMR